MTWVMFVRNIGPYSLNKKASLQCVEELGTQSTNTDSGR